MEAAFVTSIVNKVSKVFAAVAVTSTGLPRQTYITHQTCQLLLDMHCTFPTHSKNAALRLRASVFDVCVA